MKSESYEIGYKLMSSFDPDAIPELKKSFDDIAPDLPGLNVEIGYGIIKSRPGLNPQEKEMVTVAALVALGIEHELEKHIIMSLTVGTKPEKIVESFLQLIPYVGFPRVNGAVRIAKKVFADRKIVIKKSK